MPRIIGIDYGIKRCGISVTDPDQIIVNPLTVIETNKLFEYLDNYLKTENVEKIVIGIAHHKDGNEVYFENDIKLFINKIKQSFPQIVIDRQNEDFTSQQAFDILIVSGTKKSKRKDKSLIDKISAVLILQKYLNHI
ncbi:MAG: Holliday junction resolvase RuvX [Saprospiraceae bacterium]